MAKQPSDQPQSMLQGLQGILGQLGAMMVAPDADVNFLTQLQHVIVGKVKQSTQQAIGGGGPGGGPGRQIAPGGGGGMSGMGANIMGSGGPPGGTGPGGPPMGGGGPPGMGGGAPNPDELRRVLGANGMTQ